MKKLQAERLFDQARQILGDNVKLCLNQWGATGDWTVYCPEDQEAIEAIKLVPQATSERQLQNIAKGNYGLDNWRDIPEAQFKRVTLGMVV